MWRCITFVSHRHFQWTPESEEIGPNFVFMKNSRAGYEPHIRLKISRGAFRNLYCRHTRRRYRKPCAQFRSSDHRPHADGRRHEVLYPLRRSPPPRSGRHSAPLRLPERIRPIRSQRSRRGCAGRRTAGPRVARYAGQSAKDACG